MATIVNAKFKQKRGTEASIPVLLEGELYVCTDSKKLYVGSASGNQLICDISQLNAKVNKGQIVNNFLTTEEGYVADARTVKNLNDDISKRLSKQLIDNCLLNPLDITVNSGMYGVFTDKEGTINVPDGFHIGNALVLHFNSEWHQVILFELNPRPNKIYINTYTNGLWGSWIEK